MVESGRLIVEVVNHRIKTEGDVSTKRVVLSPTQETLWADLSLLHEDAGESWSNDLMLDVESKILVWHLPTCAISVASH